MERKWVNRQLGFPEKKRTKSSLGKRKHEGVPSLRGKKKTARVKRGGFNTSAAGGKAESAEDPYTSKRPEEEPTKKK